MSKEQWELFMNDLETYRKDVISKMPTGSKTTAYTVLLDVVDMLVKRIGGMKE